MDGRLLCAVLAGALGAGAGLTLPQMGQTLCTYKKAKKGQPLEPAPRYTGWEARILCGASNAVGWGLCWYLGAPAPAVLASVLWSLGTVLILVDLRLRIIPNELLAAMTVLGVALQILVNGLSGLSNAIFATLVVMTAFMMLGNFMGLYKIGAGDVKLAAVMALTLGVPCVLSAMGAMALSMLLFCGAGLLLRKLTLRSMIPFGPFLVPGLWVGMLLFLV